LVVFFFFFNLGRGEERGVFAMGRGGTKLDFLFCCFYKTWEVPGCMDGWREGGGKEIMMICMYVSYIQGKFLMMLYVSCRTDGG
jgi:hypothetical protein